LQWRLSRPQIEILAHTLLERRRKIVEMEKMKTWSFSVVVVVDDQLRVDFRPVELSAIQSRF
jgi:hypothetical protein